MLIMHRPHSTEGYKKRMKYGSMSSCRHISHQRPFISFGIPKVQPFSHAAGPPYFFFILRLYNCLFRNTLVTSIRCSNQYVDDGFDLSNALAICLSFFQKLFVIDRGNLRHQPRVGIDTLC